MIRVSPDHPALFGEISGRFRPVLRLRCRVSQTAPTPITLDTGNLPNEPTEQPSAPQTQAGGDDQPSNADPEPMLPDCHAPYSGKNSLTPRYEKATSRVMTLYTGVRLNDSTDSG